MAGFHRKRKRTRRDRPANGRPDQSSAEPTRKPDGTPPPPTQSPSLAASHPEPAASHPEPVAPGPERTTSTPEDAESVPTPADIAAAHRVREPHPASPRPDHPPVPARRPEPAAETTAVVDPDEETREPQPADRETERGLRGLVGSGSSQVSVGAACRARDAARATDDDIARAEAELTIVRRNWVPREPFRPTGRR